MDHFLHHILPVILNFAAVVTILYLALRKSSRQFFADRAQGIKVFVAEAETLSADASSQLNQWEDKTRSQQKHSEAMFQEAKQAMERLRQTTLERTKAEVERVKKESGLIVASETQSAKESLGKELVERSIKTAKNVLSSSLTEDDRQALFNDYVEMVSDGSAR